MRSLFLLALLTLTSLGLHFSTAQAQHSEAKDMEEAIESMQDLVPPKDLLTLELPIEIRYGDADAPIKIVEYASLSCGHCKTFHSDVFKPLKTKMIDTGEVQFTYRHFPLNASALRGAMLVQCVEDSTRQKLFLDALFKTQEDWAFVQTPEELEEKLINVGRVGGMDKDDVQKCLKDEAMETSILAHQLEANKYLKISGTPAVFINGEVYTGVRSYDHLETAIKTIVAKQAGESEANETKSEKAAE